MPLSGSLCCTPPCRKTYITISTYDIVTRYQGDCLENRIARKFFQGFISIHILYHAKKERFFGSWMIDELKNHGYKISAGTLYPMLHSLQRDGLIVSENEKTGGKIRKYYSITPLGDKILVEARARASELFKEIRA